LHFLDGLTVDQLRDIEQVEADKRVSKLFGISRAHSVLLRIINDGRLGAPTCVIRNPEQVLGDQAQVVLAFWRHLDCMTPEARAEAREAAKEAAWEAAWEAAGEAAWAAAWAAAEAAAWEAAWEAAGEAAGEAAREAAWEAAWAAAREAAGAAAEAAARAAAEAAAWASNEIQGAAVMRAKNQPFFFLPLFGFVDPESIISSPT
jgi:hypothetical protein